MVASHSLNPVKHNHFISFDDPESGGNYCSVLGKSAKDQAHSEGSVTLPASSCSAIVGSCSFVLGEANKDSPCPGGAPKGVSCFALMAAWFWIPTPSCREKSSEVDPAEKACSSRSTIQDLSSKVGTHSRRLCQPVRHNEMLDHH